MSEVEWDEGSWTDGVFRIVSTIPTRFERGRTQTWGVHIEGEYTERGSTQRGVVHRKGEYTERGNTQKGGIRRKGSTYKEGDCRERGST